MSIETTVYTLPSHWACALINDDQTGLEVDDIVQLNQFMRGEGLGAPLDISEEGHFCVFHDARGYGVLPCDCSDYTFPAPV